MHEARSAIIPDIAKALGAEAGLAHLDGHDMLRRRLQTLAYCPGRPRFNSTPGYYESVRTVNDLGSLTETYSHGQWGP